MFQFGCGIGQTGERKRPAFFRLKPEGGASGNAFPVIQPPAPLYFHPGSVHMHSAVLRDQAGRNRKSFYLIDSRNPSRLSVRICFPGHSLISKSVRTGGHDETHAEKRKFRKPLHSMIMGPDLYHASAVDLIKYFGLRRRNRNCFIRTGNPYP